MNLPLPALKWLRAYDRSWLRGDLVAALTLAAERLSARRESATADAPDLSE